MLDIARLKTQAAELFEEECRYLEQTGSVRSVIIVLAAQGNLIFAVDSIMNDEAAKAAFGRRLHATVKERNAEGVLSVFDTFISEGADTPEERARDAERRRLRLTLQQWAALGQCQIREAVVAFLETPLIHYQFRRCYARKQQQRQIEWLGPVEEHEAEVSERSRFAGFWSAQQTARA